MNSLFRLCIGAALGIAFTAQAYFVHAQSSSSTSATAMNMKPFEEPTYKPSLPISDQKALLQALSHTHDQKHLVKMPVVIQLTNNGMRGWASAYIGTQVDAQDPIFISLDDAVLGISLADRIHQYCPAGDWCKLWLVGYWEDQMVRYDECSPQLTKPMRRLSIRHVAGPQADADVAEVFVAKR